MVMYEVYVIYSRSLHRHYVGQTKDFGSRLGRHNSGKVPSTKHGVPWEVLFTQKVTSRSEAVRLESKIKKRGAKRYLEELGM